MNNFVYAFFFILLNTIPLIGSTQNIDLKLEELLVIGKEDSDTLEYLFSGIGGILVNNRGDILVSNFSDNSIRVFNSKGQFQKKIGQRGRGPGDFLNISYMGFGENNTLMVTDRFQDRISFFDIDGKLLRTATINDTFTGASLRYIFQREHIGDYLVSYRNFTNADKDGYMFHLYNGAFDVKLGNYLDIYSQFFDSSIPFEVKFSQVPVYFSTEFGADQIAFAPSIYTGTIASLNIRTLDMTTLGSPISEPYKLYDINKSDYYMATGETGFSSVSGSGGRFFFKMRGANVGLVGNSRFLLHFYNLYQGKESHLYLTVYAAESGKLLTSLPLKDVFSQFNIDNRTSIVPHYLDEENNLYTATYHLYPSIRVFKTNLDELLVE